MNPVCVYIFDVHRSKQVDMKFFSICSTSVGDCSKSKTLLHTINKALRNNGLDWENSRITLNQYEWAQLFKKSHQHWKSGTFIAGCNCDLAHLAACKGREGYCSATGFDIKEHQIDLFYFFKNSTRRKCILAKYLHQLDVFN